MPIYSRGKASFTKEEIAEVLDGLGGMFDCAIERDDEKDQRVLGVAMVAVRFILGDGKSDCSVKGWSK